MLLHLTRIRRSHLRQAHRKKTDRQEEGKAERWDCKEVSMLKQEEEDMEFVGYKGVWKRRRTQGAKLDADRLGKDRVN